MAMWGPGEEVEQCWHRGMAENERDAVAHVVSVEVGDISPTVSMSSWPPLIPPDARRHPVRSLSSHAASTVQPHPLDPTVRDPGSLVGPSPKRPRLGGACGVADLVTGPLELTHEVHFRDLPCDDLLLTEAEAAALCPLIRQVGSKFQPRLLLVSDSVAECTESCDATGVKSSSPLDVVGPRPLVEVEAATGLSQTALASLAVPPSPVRRGGIGKSAPPLESASRVRRKLRGLGPDNARRRTWRRYYSKVLEALLADPEVDKWFGRAVNLARYPTYVECILPNLPTDLRLVLDQLRGGDFETLEHCQVAVRIVWGNAARFNRPGSRVCVCAERAEALHDRLLRKFRLGLGISAGGRPAKGTIA